jgi:hypothetical protein
MADDNTVTLVRLILAIILPPLGVFLKHGIKVRRRSSALSLDVRRRNRRAGHA